jgi:hypothetical protein
LFGRVLTDLRGLDYFRSWVGKKGEKRGREDGGRVEAKKQKEPRRGLLMFSD